MQNLFPFIPHHRMHGHPMMKPGRSPLDRRFGSINPTCPGQVDFPATNGDLWVQVQEVINFLSPVYIGQKRNPYQLRALWGCEHKQCYHTSLAFLSSPSQCSSGQAHRRKPKETCSSHPLWHPFCSSGAYALRKPYHFNHCS